MPKYLLLKHYSGGPEQHKPCPPMDQWAPEGEFVDAQALTPAQTWVRYGGPEAAPVVTDAPHPETADLVAGWYMVDVDSYERALELAAWISSEPGRGASQVRVTTTLKPSPSWLRG